MDTRDTGRMTPAPESPDAALARKLHEAGSGHDEWRVQDPVHGSYVVAYTSLETATPERDARTWLTASQHQEGTYSHFVVAHQRVQTTADKLMQEAAAAITRLTAERDAALRDAERWRALYRRAVNEANGLTNYVEDRPELRSAERKLTAIEAEARAALTPTQPKP